MDDFAASKKKLAVRNLVMVAAATAGLFLIGSGYFVSTRKPIEIRKFIGSPLRIEGDAITLKGVYELQGVAPQDLLESREFTFRVGEGTSYKKIGLQLPSWKELAARGATGTLSLADLPRNDATGSLDDLRSMIGAGGVSVEAAFPATIYRSSNPVASVVTYRIITPPSRE